MRRRTKGDMAKVRKRPKEEYPYKDAPFDWQLEHAYRMYQEYKKHGGKDIITDEQAFRAGVIHAFGWVQGTESGLRWAAAQVIADGNPDIAREKIKSGIYTRCQQEESHE